MASQIVGTGTAHRTGEESTGDPSDKRALLWMIDCMLKKDEEAAASEFASKFLYEVPDEQIESQVNRILDEGLMAQDSKQYLSQWIFSQVRAQQFRMLKSAYSL